MDVSIVHTEVRVDPELVVEVVALVDGRAIRVHLAQDAIDHLLGPEFSNQKTLFVALQHKLETIRIAIEAHVLARGAPLDQYFVLSWRDFSLWQSAT